MKILIACEFSGIVRDAFKAVGHDVISCDLLDTEQPGKHHIGDVRDILYSGFDMMIAHPPCTYLTNAQAWTYARPDRFPNRLQQRQEAIDFFMLLKNAPIRHICIENPIPMGIVQQAVGKYDQVIQPYQFGHAESKSTCLWLKELPLLRTTKFAEWKQYVCKCGNVFEAALGKYGCCDAPARIMWDNQTRGGQNKLSPGADRWKERSRTYPGIAEAMANQWGAIDLLY